MALIGSSRELHYVFLPPSQLFRSLYMLLVLLLLPATSALVDCIDGFIGRMQATVQDSFYLVNETRMCSAAFCIKVVVHGALDDDDVFQQGISSRCAYTGGDRQLCVSMDKGCSQRANYDGMHGNFTVCCCQQNSCNQAMPSDLTSIYHSQHSKRGTSPAADRGLLLPLLLSTTFSLLVL